MSAAARLFRCLLPLLLSCCALSAPAQDCLEYADQVRYLGAVGLGTCAALEPVGDHLLAALQDASLRVYDVTDPVHPVLWDEIGLGLAQSVLVARAGYMYLGGDALGVLGVRVVRLDPVQGLVATSTILGPEPAGAIAVSGSLLAVSLRDSFSVWDVSEPLAPVRLATVNDGAQHTRLALEGDRLVTSDPAGTSRVYDLSDPAAPALVGGWPAALTGTSGLELAGNLAFELAYSYTSGGSSMSGDAWYRRVFHLRCLDLADPATPVVVATRYLSESYSRLSGSYAYLTHRGGRILAMTAGASAVTVVDPATPTEAVMVPLDWRVNALAWQDDHLYASFDDGLARAWSVPPSARRGAVPTPPDGDYVPRILGSDSYDALSVAGDDHLTAALIVQSVYDYWGGYWENRWVDLYATGTGATDPVARVGTNEFTQDIAMAGTRLYLADGLLSCVDVTVPAAPDAPVTVPGISGTRAVEPLGGDLLAVVLGTGVLQVWDLADLAAPVLVGSCAVSGYSSGLIDLVRDGDLLLVAVEVAESTVWVVDVAAPAAPVVLGQFTPGIGRTPLRLESLAPGRVLVYARGSGAHTMLVDYADPAAPFLAADVQVPWNLKSVKVHAGRVYQLGSALGELRPDDLSVIGAVQATHVVLGAFTAGGTLLALGHSTAAAVPTECALTDVGEGGAVPAPRAALAVRPNPFNPRTTVTFALGQDRDVRLAVYDLRGRRVRVLAEGAWTAGEHEAAWDGRDGTGRALASGTYLLRLEAGPESAHAKMTLLR